MHRPEKTTTQCLRASVFSRRMPMFIGLAPLIDCHSPSARGLYVSFSFSQHLSLQEQPDLLSCKCATWVAFRQMRCLSPLSLFTQEPLEFYQVIVNWTACRSLRQGMQRSYTLPIKCHRSNFPHVFPSVLLLKSLFHNDNLKRTSFQMLFFDIRKHAI